FFFSSRRRHTIFSRDWSSDVCSSDLVAFFGVELQGKATDITLGVRRAALAGHGGEAGEHVGFLAHFFKDLGTGVLGDVVGDRERSEERRVGKEWRSGVARRSKR